MIGLNTRCIFNASDVYQQHYNGRICVVTDRILFSTTEDVHYEVRFDNSDSTYIEMGVVKESDLIPIGDYFMQHPEKFYTFKGGSGVPDKYANEKCLIINMEDKYNCKIVFLNNSTWYCHFNDLIEPIKITQKLLNDLTNIGVIFQ